MSSALAIPLLCGAVEKKISLFKQPNICHVYGVQWCAGKCSAMGGCSMFTNKLLLQQRLCWGLSPEGISHVTGCCRASASVETSAAGCGCWQWHLRPRQSWGFKTETTLGGNTEVDVMGYKPRNFFFLDENSHYLHKGNSEREQARTEICPDIVKLLSSWKSPSEVLCVFSNMPLTFTEGNLN